MDSITQASLGAAVAYASWHRQLGKPALLWGAAIGTIPDLDVLLYPFLDDIQSEDPDILTRNSPSIRDSKAAVTVLWKRLIGACLPYL
jgi:hypothetical protein